ncbi:MAG: hypothetical protein HKN13_01415, partial [Rhodothermales bacterium]|nr:hypothetical protein [Rhodothermales bacterium]
MISKVQKYSIVVVVLLLSACASSRPYVNERNEGWRQLEVPATADIAYKVILVGGLGDHDSNRAETLPMLRSHVQQADSNSAIVFLGDQFADTDPGIRQGDSAKSLLTSIAETIEGFSGRVVIIPGDLEWDRGKSSGIAGLASREQTVERVLQRENVFLPDQGFPGPATVKLTDEIVLLALDTQWWLHGHSKSFGDTGDYGLEEDGDFLLELDDIVQRRRNKKLLVVGHHSMYSNGPHAGRYSFREHVFPLTTSNRFAYLPLPVVGSLSPLYARYFGKSSQDLAAPRYAALRRALTRIFERHDGLIYAAGHERSLQYFAKGTLRSRQHYIVSGSGSGATYTAPGNGARFAAGIPGFVTLTYHHNGEVWMEAWTPSSDDPAGSVAFRTQLEPADPEAVAREMDRGSTTDYPDYRDSTVTVAINPAYATGRKGRWFYGRRYRNSWAAPVTFPVLDLGREAGGLTVTKRGGGVQTFSLHFEGANGKKYVLRSIDKDPSRSVPSHLQVSAGTDFVQDQVSSLHPYGLWPLSFLYEAADLYHINPRPVYVPHDARLGVYQDQFAGQIMTFEERPDDDESDMAHFGFSKKVMSSSKLFREINGDNDHRVDQRMFLRARLIDILIADWDRHEDQWRWASIEPTDGKGKIYRPIPRDHDWAFFSFDGFIASKLKFVMPKFQSFDYKYGDIRGLTRKGLSQDRRFTAELTKQ